MHASVSRVAGSARTPLRPLSSSTRWNSCGPSPARVPVQTELYGFIRSAVEERGRSCRNASMSCQRGSTFSMPITEISTRGRVTHMRPLPSDSKITTDPVSAMAKLAPLIAKGTVRNFSRRYRRAAPSEIGRRVGEVFCAGKVAFEDLADLGPVAVNGGHEDVRG